MVVGDVTPEEVRKIAERKIRPRAVARARAAHRRTAAAAPRRDRAMDFAIPGTKLPQLFRMYRVPSYVKSPSGAAESMEVMTAILGNGATSRMYKTLVVDKKLAVEAGASYDGHNRGPGNFVVYAVPRDGVSFDTLETAMDQVIATMMRAPPRRGRVQPRQDAADRRLHLLARQSISARAGLRRSAFRSGSASRTSRTGPTASAPFRPPTCARRRKPMW
jgi:zinc protease